MQLYRLDAQHDLHDEGAFTRFFHERHEAWIESKRLAAAQWCFDFYPVELACSARVADALCENVWPIVPDTALLDLIEPQTLLRMADLREQLAGRFHAP